MVRVLHRASAPSVAFCGSGGQRQCCAGRAAAPVRCPPITSKVGPVQPRPTSICPLVRVCAAPGAGAGLRVHAPRPARTHVGAHARNEVGQLDGSTSQARGRKARGVAASGDSGGSCLQAGGEAGVLAMAASGLGRQRSWSSPETAMRAHPRQVDPAVNAGDLVCAVARLGGGSCRPGRPVGRPRVRPRTGSVRLNGSSQAPCRTGHSSPPHSVVIGVPKGVVSGECFRAAP